MVKTYANELKNGKRNGSAVSILALAWAKIKAFLGVAVQARDGRCPVVDRSDAPAKPMSTARPYGKRRAFRSGRPSSRKPVYRPVGRGTTFLVDTANLIGAIGPEHAAARLANLGDMLTCAGHSVVFFWEHAAYTWTKAQQATEEEKRALKAFVARENVSLVSGESDLAILQAAQVTPNSICLTRDRFNDYAETYPKIVGTLRHRSFSVAKIAGMLTLSVFGLKYAIVLSKPETRRELVPVRADMSKPKVSALTSPAVETVRPIRKTAVVRSQSPARRAGLYGCVDARLVAGDGRKALVLLSQIARTDPEAYAEMSRIYREGDGLPSDAQAAKRYAHLAKEGAKAARQLARRRKRQLANCMTSLDYVSMRGGKDLFLARRLEECADRKNEGQALRRLASQKHKRFSAHFVRIAA